MVEDYVVVFHSRHPSFRSPIVAVDTDPRDGLFFQHVECVIPPGRVARFFGETMDKRVARARRRCREWIAREKTIERVAAEWDARYNS